MTLWNTGVQFPLPTARALPPSTDITTPRHEPQTAIRQITKDGKWTVEELQFLAPNFLFSGVQNPAPPPSDLQVPGRPVQTAGS